MAIGPGDRVGGTYLKGTASVFSSEITRTIAPQRASLLTPNQAERVWKLQRVLSENIHSQGEKVYKKEIRKQRRIDKGIKASKYEKKRGKKIEKIPTAVKKSKGAKRLYGKRGIGGGKHVLPGLETGRNPTGMSLITQRYTL